jgi:hypothetical protein
VGIGTALRGKGRAPFQGSITRWSRSTRGFRPWLLSLAPPGLKQNRRPWLFATAPLGLKQNRRPWLFATAPLGLKQNRRPWLFATAPLRLKQNRRPWLFATAPLGPNQNRRPWPFAANPSGLRQNHRLQASLSSAVEKAIVWLTLLLFLSIPSTTHAIGEFIPSGGHSAGMGDAFVALAHGAEGLFWNPGAVSMGDGLSAAAGYDRPFGISELETVSGAGRVRFGRIAAGITHQGAAEIGESSTGAIVGVRVKEVGVGVQVRHVRYDLNVGHSWTVFDLGVVIESKTGIRVGMVGWNAGGSHTGILGHGGMIGVAVTRSGNTITVDVQKEVGTPTGGGVGIEWQVHRDVAIRIGVGGHPERMTLGMGVTQMGATFDYGILYHTVLGLSHRASMSVSR